MTQPFIIILTIGVYFIALLTVAHLCSRGANNATYFTGNRNMAWPVVALAMITAPISGITFISVPGMVLTKGYGYLQMCLGFLVGYFLIGWILVPLFYRRNIISIYSFLHDRFGKKAQKTGAWLFLISEIGGVGVRFFVVCIVLQMLVFAPLNLPFSVNVLVTMFLIWLYTARGGVKSVIWSDTVKSVCLVASVILIFIFIASKLNYSVADLPQVILSHHNTQIFYLDDFRDSSYFWKQFLTGVFIVVAMTGLDQDMMQRVLACRDAKGARKNLAVGGLLQFVVIALFLCLGTLLLLFTEANGLELPEKSDDIFAMVAFYDDMPFIVGILFVLGLVSASYSSVGSALTSLTTSYTVDVLDGTKKYDENSLKKLRKYVHASMAVIMALVILIFYHINHQDAISALFTLASYSYGPILGLFIFGIYTKRMIDTRLLALVCVLAPIISGVVSYWLDKTFGYHMGFELFLLNTLLTLLGLRLLPAEKLKYEENPQTEPASI